MDEDREPGSLPSALTGCVTWGKALCFSEPQFVLKCNGAIIVLAQTIDGRIRCSNAHQALESCLADGTCHY